MIEICQTNILTMMISLGLIFILFMTNAYKRSITTAIYVVSVAISMQIDDSETATIIIISGAAAALLRAVLLGGEDKILRGR